MNIKNKGKLFTNLLLNLYLWSNGFSSEERSHSGGDHHYAPILTSRMEFFKASQQNLNLPDGSVFYFPNFLRKELADKYLEVFLTQLEWEQRNIKIFGKTISQPRLTALYAINDIPYTYSNLTLIPKKFTTEISELHKKLKIETDEQFTHCLANLYRDGKDSMGWHSDDEKELGKNPVIASISLGGVRTFYMKHKSKDSSIKLDLEHGSLLMMAGTTQHFWKHQLPKTQKPVSPRINLTFRRIL